MHLRQVFLGNSKHFALLFFLGFRSISGFSIGLDEIEPAKAASSSQATPPESGNATSIHESEMSKTPEQTLKPQEQAPPQAEPGRAERWLHDNLTLAVGTNLVWPSRGDGWTASGSGRTGNADLIVSLSVPNSVLNLRKQKSLKLKGTFRYNPVVVTGTFESQPYRGVWAGYHGGLEAHLTPADFYGMTAVAGVEAGFVLVYLQPLDDFEKATSAESTGAMVTIHGGGDWTVGNGIKCGPRVYMGFGSIQNYQLGATTTFLF